MRGFILLFNIILCLGIPEFPVFALRVLQQLRVGSLLDDPTFVKNGNLITELAGGQPVADIHGCPILHHTAEAGLARGFANGIQGGSGLVQHDNRRPFIQCPGQRNLLRFAAGDFHALF